MPFGEQREDSAIEAADHIPLPVAASPASVAPSTLWHELPFRSNPE